MSLITYHFVPVYWGFQDLIWTKRQQKALFDCRGPSLPRVPIVPSALSVTSQLPKSQNPEKSIKNATKTIFSPLAPPCGLRISAVSRERISTEMVHISCNHQKLLPSVSLSLSKWFIFSFRNPIDQCCSRQNLVLIPFSGKIWERLDILGDLASVVILKNWPKVSIR